MFLPEPGKRVFLALMVGCLAVMSAVLFLIWYLSVNQLFAYQKTILVLGAMLGLVLMILAAVGAMSLLVTLWKGSSFCLVNSVPGLAINLLFPLILRAGRMLGLDEDKIKGSFIEVNNQLVSITKPQTRPGGILVLAPHCLQFNGCPHKITNDIGNCAGCGRCQVSEFRKMKDEYGINVAVATGGILDSHPLPVFGVLNERPHGPCQDTTVNFNRVRAAVHSFIGIKPIAAGAETRIETGEPANPVPEEN